MKQVKAELIESGRSGEEYVIHRYRSPEIAQKAEPGQFVHIKVSHSIHPVLRRPISILDASGDEFRILFKIVGEGTQILSRAKTEELVDMIGPVGNAFPLENKPAVMIAGGIGVAPLVFLSSELRRQKRKIVFFYGARSKRDIVMTDEISAHVDELHIATEDGSIGEKGLITDFADNFLTGENTIYACGPEPMLRALQTRLEQKDIRAWFSLENKMACGVGACQGCVVKTSQGHQRVCIDGPVFSSNKIKEFPNL